MFGIHEVFPKNGIELSKMDTFGKI